MVATQPKIERAMPSEELYRIMQSIGIISFHAAKVSEAVAAGKKLAGRNGLLVITGSHYIVGEAIQALKI